MELLLKAIVLAIFILFSEFAYTAESHCIRPEMTVFSCRTGTKVVSVCGSNVISSQMGYLQYRFGSLESPEFIYPNKKIKPGQWVTGNTLIYAGGGGAYLRFIRNRYHYIVYTAIGRGWGERAGVIVEKDGFRKANLSCNNQLISELGADFFERAQIVVDQIGFELPD